MPLAITINERSATPKYRQIANCIVRNIERKEVQLEEQLPSINQLSNVYNISRDTAEKAYRLLKTKGVIKSVRGKGYFASHSHSTREKRILLIFNKLSSYKEEIYQSFIQTVDKEAWVDLQIYYEDYSRFERIIKEKASQFTDIVLIPAFRGSDALRAARLIRTELKEQHVVLLNQALDEIDGHNGLIAQNYQKDILHASKQIQNQLKKYERIVLLFPFDRNYPSAIIRGVQEAGKQYGLETQIVFKDYHNMTLRQGELYVIVRDEQLVCVADKIKHSELVLGKDIGILAYNDSPLKKVLLGGISVMSTDHHAMGVEAAEMILKQNWSTREVPFSIVDRGSI